MKKGFKKGISYWILGATGLMMSSLLHASTPVWTYSAPSPASVTVSEQGTATVQYTVTNQSRKPKNLVLQATPGINASACYLAGKGSSCSLTLSINGKLIPQQGIHTGPVLCEQGNPNQCYQPSAANQLRINRSAMAGHLLLSQYGLPITNLSLSPGESGTLLLSNTGGQEVSSLSIQFPSGWESYFTSHCPTLLTPQQSCSISYAIPIPSAVGIFNPLIIQGTGADNTISLPVSIQVRGAVNCWGSNGFGQLGDGSSPGTFSSIPVVAGSFTNAIAITGGLAHSCALLASGAVNCWGQNFSGQLGNGNSGPGTNSNIPVTAGSFTNAVAITAGNIHSCALLTTGAVNCWGDNFYGQLGNGSNTNSSNPVTAGSFTNATAITGGGFHSCALLANGAVNCWGNNGNGQLGNSSTTNSSTPVTVVSLTNAVAITAGVFHSCALLANGEVYCWGDNSAGQLGNGNSPTDSSTPVRAGSFTNAVAITGGGLHSCALLTTGVVNCWGDNFYGQLGNGSPLPGPDSNTPVTVTGISNAVAITGGNTHNCALLATGAVNCWGENNVGQLGNGDTTNSSTPLTTCSALGCPGSLLALELFNHNLGFHSCAIVPAP